MTNPDQAKFQIVTSTLLPHKCLACEGKADGTKQFVDFGVSIDYEGAMYICVSCAEEIARTVSYIPPYERDEAILENDRLRSDLIESEERVRSLTDTFVSFNMSIPDDRRSGDSDVELFKVDEAGKPDFEAAESGPFK